MCIRDSSKLETSLEKLRETTGTGFQQMAGNVDDYLDWYYSCLLYTSDAADERSSVDLGGRRIIKKKNTIIEWGSGSR